MENIESSGVSYVVVVNHEDQYSIWPSNKAVPAGWEAKGEPREKADCLAYIEEVWKDMRPLSTRIRQGERAGATDAPSSDGSAP